jgi:predicted RND superfamily exporter protein
LLVARIHPEKVPVVRSKDSMIQTFLFELMNWVRMWKWVVLGGFALVVCMFGYLLTRVEVEVDTLKMFKSDSVIGETYRKGTEWFGGWAPLEFSLVSKSGRPVNEPEILREIEKFQKYLEELPSIDKSLSIVDFIKKGRQELRGGAKEFSQIPETVEEAARLIGFIEMVGGREGLSNYFREDGKRTRITAWSFIMPSRQYGEVFEEINSYIGKNIDPDLEIRNTGGLWLGQRLLSQILLTEVQSFALAFLLISLCLIFALRSWKLALVALPPNVFPVAVVLGTMSVTGIFLDVGTCTIASIVIAMAVDDTIHFLHKFREVIEVKKDYTLAMMETMEKVGPPIVYTSLVLMAGFWVLVFSSYIPALNFGFLSGIAVFVALIGDIVVLPALLFWLRPVRFLKPMWQLPQEATLEKKKDTGVEASS